MYLKKFLKKNNIVLSPKLRRLCLRGIKKMGKSINIGHGQAHVYGMLDDLHKLLRDKKKDLTKKIDFDILLPAICWHDVWKTKRKIGSNLITILTNLLWDGFGSMFAFGKATKKLRINSRKRKLIMYAIRKHADVQVFSLKTLEAKILRDLDELDVFSRKRLAPMVKYFLKVSPINKKNLETIDFYIKHWWERRSEQSFYLSWFKKEVKKRKQPFLKRVYKLRKKYRRLLRKHLKTH